MDWHIALAIFGLFLLLFVLSQLADVLFALLCAPLLLLALLVRSRTSRRACRKTPPSTP
jgi:hypothetical protein